jgi:hypothetical protein
MSLERAGQLAGPGTTLDSPVTHREEARDVHFPKA